MPECCRSLWAPRLDAVLIAVGGCIVDMPWETPIRNGHFVAKSTSKNIQMLPKHLRRLEAESIAIMRDVVAEFRRPVMLCSIGKDSSVMLHIAMKAFYPAKLPFPLLHVETTWKFHEMISFRDETATRLWT
ncbi:3'-phosphoadenosine 5'-phosphosulfate sulfotransferase (PAPS reductase)/FAD synthetase [Bradyrhizobium sp. USDA 4341]